MDIVLFGLTGFLFTFFTITGWELERNGNIAWTLGHTAFLLILSLILGIVAGEGLRFLFLFLDKKHGKVQEKEWKTKWKPRTVWFGSTALILLARLPFFLAYYPGICAYDMSIQLGQVRSGDYNLHHPLAHTLLLKAAVDLGNNVFHDATKGIACMVFGQAFVLAMTMAFGIAYLYKKRLGRGWLVFLQVFWMVYPYYGYLSVSVTKDVVFAIFFLLQVVGLLALLWGEKHWGWDALFVVSSVIMQLYRNNGTYAFLVLEGILFLCLVFWKKERKLFLKLFLEGAGALLLGVMVLGGLTKVTGALQGDKREMLSVPIQQLARCMIHHGGVSVLDEDDNTMGEVDKALINDFLLYESYKKYDEKLADPVKGNTNTYVVRYRTKDFFKTYFHLLSQYPGDMVNAFLSLNAGYFYLGDESHGRIYELRELEGLSYVHTRWDPAVEESGIYRWSAFEKTRGLLSWFADQNVHLKLPILKYLFVPAIVFWAFVIMLVNGIRRKNYKPCIALALIAGYYFTLFLGPCVQLRYLFPLLVVLPYFLCVGRLEKK